MGLPLLVRWHLYIESGPCIIVGPVNEGLTRNCSKLRKIHSGQRPISLTINPSEFKFFGQFVLLWFKFSQCQLMSLQFLHMTSMTRDPYVYAVKACAKFVLMTRKWNTTKWNFNHTGNVHYSDVIMSALASQITGVLIVCLNVCSVADQRKHQSSMWLAFVRGIHRWQVNSPHKGPVTRKMFPFDDVIMAWKSSDEMGPGH